MMTVYYLYAYVVTGSLLALPKVAVKCCLQGIQPSDGGNDWLGDTALMMQEVLSYCKALLLVVSCTWGSSVLMASLKMYNLSFLRFKYYEQNSYAIAIV